MTPSLELGEVGSKSCLLGEGDGLLETSVKMKYCLTCLLNLTRLSLGLARMDCDLLSVGYIGYGPSI